MELKKFLLFSVLLNDLSESLIVDLKIVWWNCHLSAPSTSAKKKEISMEFFAALKGMLDCAVDLFCFCEVSEQDSKEIALEIERLSEEKVSFCRYKILSLYRKEGNSIDDFAIVYDSEKLRLLDSGVSLNTYSDVTDKSLKVGRQVKFCFMDKTSFWVIMCHWQSQRTYPEGSVLREALGSALRESVNSILNADIRSLVAICGDFNDEPFGRSIEKCLMASRDPAFVKAKPKALFNPFWRVLGVSDLKDASSASPGTCYTTDKQHMTSRRLFDQIILSSGFLGAGWQFLGLGAEVLSEVSVDGDLLRLDRVSDHYPIVCSLQRSTL